MADEPKNDPRNRMRSLLGTPPRNGGEMKEQGAKSSPLTRLPKKAEAASVTQESPAVTAPPPQKKSPDQTPPRPAPVSPPPASAPPKRRRLSFGPPFWTITGGLSLIVNIILFTLLVLAYLNLRTLNLGGVMNMSSGLLGGLYTNFEKMDRAHIITNIQVNTTIPVKFDLPLNQETNVVLSQDVRIDNARVTVNTGGLNISNALTTIILPQGTNLPIILSLTVPVDQSVPVTLNVPVDMNELTKQLVKVYEQAIEDKKANRFVQLRESSTGSTVLPAST